jgi:DNA invertase Pin-like site-specific DNA recombinase
MIFGYARVSTDIQNLDLQVDNLKKAGCTEIFQEKISGSTKERPELNKLLDKLRDGDTIVVWRLDRLGRSLVNIIHLVLELQQKGVTIKGISDGVDTSTATGRLMLNIMASFAEYERELIRERTNASLQAARARGRIGGRPSGYNPETIAKMKLIRKFLDDETISQNGYRAIYEPMNIKHATFFRYLKLINKYTDSQLDTFIKKNPKGKK